MVPAHYVVELDQVGCPDPVAALSPVLRAARRAGLRPISTKRRRPTSARPRGGRGSGLRECRRASAVARGVLGRHRQHGRCCCSRGDASRGARAESRLDCARSRSISAAASDAAQAEDGRARARHRATAGNGSIARRRATTSKRRSASIEDYHPLDVECAAAALCLLRGIRERYPVAALPARRRRRRREPEVVPARGFGPDAVERAAESAAVSGRVGRRRHQAQPRLFRRPVARIRADVRARGGDGFTAFSPFSVRSVIAAAVGDPVRAGPRRDASSGCTR